MATNLIADIMNEFHGDTLTRIASAVGETPEKTGAAFGAIVPALIGGLASSTSTSDQASTLLSVIRDNGLDSGLFTDISSAVRAPGGMSSLVSMGRPLMNSLFGARVGGITDWVSSLSGVSRSNSSALLGVALPLILGQIGKRVMNLGGSASSLMSLLGDQRQFLPDAPPGLADVLSESGRPIGTRDENPATFAGAYSKMPFRSAWLWVLPAFALIPFLMFLLWPRTAPPKVAVATRPTDVYIEVRPSRSHMPPETVGTSGVATTGTADLGAFMDRRLPNDVMLRIPAQGVEWKLLEYVGAPSRIPGKEASFSLDRVEFETDSATLRPGATEQLQNVATIMKAYPTMKIEIGGYTDNTASSSYNVNLSQDRANAAMHQIAGFGVDSSRLSAEGYGEAHPVADNATAEGRQRNRRVDVRVTEK